MVLVFNFIFFGGSNRVGFKNVEGCDSENFGFSEEQPVIFF